MAVYVHVATLFVKKSSVKEKYHGGEKQFRIDFDMSDPTVNQEDDLLFSLGHIDIEDFELKKLLERGLSFDKEKQYSYDFSILSRYDGFLWDTPWLNHNSVFAWHKDDHQTVINRALEISEMNMDYIAEEYEKGNNLFFPIRLADMF